MKKKSRAPNYVSLWFSTETKSVWRDLCCWVFQFLYVRMMKPFEIPLLCLRTKNEISHETEDQNMRSKNRILFFLQWLNLLFEITNHIALTSSLDFSRRWWVVWIDLYLDVNKVSRGRQNPTRKVKVHKPNDVFSAFTNPSSLLLSTIWSRNGILIVF